jgi:diguanylate cyclase (GGDEF)-like protein
MTTDVTTNKLWLLTLLLFAHDQDHAELQYRATYDSLTGLLNRATFYALLENACEQRSPKFALLYIDLNGFKNVNDTYGHAAGDRLLKVVGGRILAAVRNGDAVARIGGDEFTVLLPGASAVEASVICDRISRAIAEPIEDAEIGSATGIATWEYGDTPDAVVARADQAMYLAKRNRQSCRGNASACALPIDQVQEIDQALANGEIVPFFQPIAATRNRRIVGYEVLARWCRNGEIVAPGSFLPIIEEAGWMPRLDWLMLTQGLASLEYFDGQWLSVNISGPTLFDPEFSQRLARELETFFASPDQIRLEISESIAIGVKPLLHGPIAQLKSLAHADTNLGLLVDDYGSAYAHLLAIMQLCQEVPNVQAIKLVGDLVSGIDSSPAKLTICRTTIELAHGLGLDTIAEGVETEAEALTLRGLHCDYLQGYYLGRPLPLDQYIPYVEIDPC